VDRRDGPGYDENDIQFAQTYANVLAAAMARQRSGAAMRSLLRQRQVLLHELQHRVRNDLQVVIAVVTLQHKRAAGAEAKEALAAVLGRLDALAMAHRRLEMDEPGRIRLDVYLRDLAHERFRMHGLDPAGTIMLDIRQDPVEVDHDRAVNLGLVANEFLTNTFKHAFPDGKGIVSISLTRRGNEASLKLRDNGAGSGGPPDRRSEGLGQKLIPQLAGQVGGEITWGNGPGTSLEIRFSIPPI
jgi:two-component sensor histidine kinase